MVTYEQLYHLDLDRLNSAVEAWDAQIRHLESLDETFARDVSKIFEQAGWCSLDVTSMTASSQIKDAGRELAEAVAEAKGVRDILRDAHTRLKKHKTDLHKLVDVEAPDRGLVVSSAGHVEARDDVTKDLPNSDDPDNEEIRSLQKRKVEDFVGRIEQILSAAGETDALASQALHSNTAGKAEDGFKGKVYTSISSYQKASEKPSSAGVHTPGAKWGSGTIKPVAEFLSYKSWINSGSSLLHGEFGKAWDYFWGGTPSYVAGKGAENLEKYPGGGGVHRKPSFVNEVGRFGGKIFGWPVAMAATVVDYYYTPESDPEEKVKRSKIVAPGQLNRKPVL
ncbi:hypothetical protein ACFC0M_06620 [Streptomyces sp. NPDC056149]|uniref:hypothetical protein n=1 Tax=Streptomyces sp. NPDC056149 TaxID=3345728 RepID=UPI0035D7F73E